MVCLRVKQGVAFGLGWKAINQQKFCQNGRGGLLLLRNFKFFVFGFIKLRNFVIPRKKESPFHLIKVFLSIDNINFDVMR
jgi:hypothetical protein